MDKAACMAQSDTNFNVGEDLYGVSVEELQTRIEVLEAEISRITGELDKKRAERDDAERLFGGKS